MSATVEKLTRDAIELLEDQRLTLAHQILCSVEPPATAAIEKAWEQEISDRIKRYREGKATTVAAEEVFAEIDSLLQKK
jgi:putative addiction module component (TIGR02574 family)